MLCSYWEIRLSEIDKYAYAYNLIFSEYASTRFKSYWVNNKSKPSLEMAGALIMNGEVGVLKPPLGDLDGLIYSLLIAEDIN